MTGELNKKLDELHRLLKKGPATYKDIINKLGVDYQYARKLMELLNSERELCVESKFVDGRKTFWLPTSVATQLSGFEATYKTGHPDDYCFALIGDTHLGSIYAKEEELHDFYDILEERGIDLVLHVGDVFESEKQTRAEQKYELKVLGYDANLEYGLNTYPKRDGIKTVMISGNHDEWYYKQFGAKVVESLAKEREDIDYVGSGLANVKINDDVVTLRHPNTGSANTRSRPLQNYIRELPNKPFIYAIGHFHKAAYNPYLGVHGFLVGGFKDDDPFSRGFPQANDVGGWIIHVKKQNGKTILIPEFINYNTQK